ncbi:MAG: hypothetical protein KatS3mg108_0139 [Isosphaeraceae bacterium]|jgi:hypothetical protein|nr:MAG: hypothetical protein KatS3mg108_0139 [Isosphaeraceae bacterium]
MDEVAREFASKVAALLDGWRAIEVEAVDRLSYGDPSGFPGAVASEVRTHYIETAGGQRFQEVRARLSDGRDKLGGQDYCDGARCAEVMFHEGDPTRQRSITISSSFAGENSGLETQRPLPLRFLYVGLKPLPQALREGAEHVGQETLLDRPCDVFLFRDVPSTAGKVILRYSLDSATGVPLAIQWFKDQGALQAGTPYRSWQAVRFETREGLPMVVEGKQVTYRDGSTVPFDQSESKVVNLRLNQDYPASTFWPEPQSGVTVRDTFTGKIETIAGREPPGATTSTATPIRADGVPAWDPAQAVMLGLGLALVAVAGALWWRNR